MHEHRGALLLFSVPGLADQAPWAGGMNMKMALAHALACTVRPLHNGTFDP